MSDAITELAAVAAELGRTAAAVSAPKLPMPEAPADSDAPASGAASFLDTLNTALQRVDSSITSAGTSAKAFAAGDRDISLSDVMISLEEANLGLQTAAAVRDKVTAAYTSIMNMQV